MAVRCGVTGVVFARIGIVSEDVMTKVAVFGPWAFQGSPIKLIKKYGTAGAVLASASMVPE
eukprot:11395787-Karenia_brevis.AAC.1